MFDPKWTNHLYPTRIPFEESSVFSRVNILNPDLKEHPLFEQVQACHVELNPGDVLYVPSHWWHFVQVIPHPDDKVSISLNLWCKHRDQFNHLQESVVQFLLTALLPTYDYTESSPPGDNDLFHVPRINDHFQLPSPNEALSMTSSMVRHAQVFEDLPDEDDQFENYNPIDVITTEEMGHILNWDQKIETTESKRSFLTNLYDALLSPDVIELVCKKLVANQKETD